MAARIPSATRTRIGSTGDRVAVHSPAPRAAPNASAARSALDKVCPRVLKKSAPKPYSFHAVANRRAAFTGVGLIHRLSTSFTKFAIRRVATANDRRGRLASEMLVPNPAMQRR